jgi:UrcA family protein
VNQRYHDAIATFRTGFATVRHKPVVTGFARCMISTRTVRETKETIVKRSTASTGRRGLIAIVIFAVLGLGLGVGAAAGASTESRTVRFSDLDIANPSAAYVLYRRIRAAAQVVCSYYFFATDTDKARCVRDATADAVTKINQPALSAVYNATNKTSVPSRLVSQSR